MLCDYHAWTKGEPGEAGLWICKILGVSKILITYFFCHQFLFFSIFIIKNSTYSKAITDVWLMWSVAALYQTPSLTVTHSLSFKEKESPSKEGRPHVCERGQRELSPNSAAALRSSDCFGVSQPTGLVFWPKTWWLVTAMDHSAAAD